MQPTEDLYWRHARLLAFDVPQMLSAPYEVRLKHLQECIFLTHCVSCFLFEVIPADNPILKVSEPLPLQSVPHMHHHLKEAILRGHASGTLCKPNSQYMEPATFYKLDVRRQQFTDCDRVNRLSKLLYCPLHRSSSVWSTATCSNFILLFSAQGVVYHCTTQFGEINPGTGIVLDIVRPQQYLDSRLLRSCLEMAQYWLPSCRRGVISHGRLFVKRPIPILFTQGLAPWLLAERVVINLGNPI